MASEPAELEARAYGPESTRAEIAAMRARVRLHDEETVLWRELPVMSVFSTDILSDELEALCAAHGCRFLIVDSRAGAKPDAAVRKRLHARSVRLEGHIEHVALVIQTNPLIKVAARFIQAMMPMTMSVHATLEQAEEEVRRVRGL